MILRRRRERARAAWPVEAQPGSQGSSRTLQRPVCGSGVLRACGAKQHAGKGLAVRAIQQRAGRRRTSHHRCASSEEERERANVSPPPRTK